jgi:hypothetical protein
MYEHTNLGRLEALEACRPIVMKQHKKKGGKKKR